MGYVGIRKVQGSHEFVCAENRAYNIAYHPPKRTTVA